MENRRRIYFPANDCHVITGMTPAGQFVAFREDAELPRGHGHSMDSAIADLAEKVQREGSIHEREEDYVEALEAAE